MTPEPKYFAKLSKPSERSDMQNRIRKAYSKADLGKCKHAVFFAMMGKVAPKDEQARTMKMEAIRSPRKRSSPPPEPQATSSSSLGKKKRRSTCKRLDISILADEVQDSEHKFRVGRLYKHMQ